MTLPDRKTLRFVTLNLWGQNGPHEARLQLVIEGLKTLDVDIAALQEVREVPGSLVNQAETVAAALGMNFVFAPATAWGGGHEGLAVLSRFPIQASFAKALPHSKPDEGRACLSAQIAGPAGSLWAHTTHLSYRQDEGRLREDQVLALDDEVRARAEPELKEQPQVLMGDFNSVPEADEVRWLSGLTTLADRRAYYQDAFAAIHPGAPGITWARENPFRARMNWLKADRRLDYIFVTPERRDGRGTIRDARVVLDQPDAAGLYPSDHAGVLADVQIFPDGEGTE